MLPEEKVQAFAEAYRRARRGTFRQASGLSHKYAPLAVQTLATVMADPKPPAGVKVSGAALVPIPVPIAG